MAKLGYGELRSIKLKILQGLYGIAKTNLNKRKQEIAKKNREYFMEPLIDKLAEIPKGLLQYGNIYQLFVRYKVDPTDNEVGINQTWEYTCKEPNSINPSFNYSKDSKGNLDPRLEAVTAILCEEIIALSAEEKEMEEFLNNTINRYSGSLQLRKVWPPSLHKYLPVEVKRTRTPRTKKEKIGNPDPTVPSSIQSRMTSNLLEGN